MNINAASMAWTFYALFLVLAALGFISDYQPVDRAFLDTNMTLNLTHLITAVGFAVVSKQDRDLTIQFIRIIGMAYMLISLIGFMGVNIVIGEQWEEVIFLNLLSYIQFSLGVVLSFFGAILNKGLRSAHV